MEREVLWRVALNDQLGPNGNYLPSGPRLRLLPGRLVDEPFAVQGGRLFVSPPGFYVVLVALIVCSALAAVGWTNVVTLILSVAAILITGVVLIQGYRDTAAIHAKLNEIIVALHETRNDVVGLEHSDPEEIQAAVERLEQEAKVLANEGAERSLPGGTRADT